MRAYLIADGLFETDPTCADAWVVDARAPLPSLRAAGEAIQGRRSDGAGVTLGCFAALAMTEEAPQLLAHIEGPDADLDGLAVLRPDAILLPARHGRDIAHLGARLAVHEAEHGLPDGGIGIVALVDSAAGILAAASFAGASPRLSGMGWDAALAEELGAEPMSAEGWSPVLAQARGIVRLATAAAGVEAIEAACPGADFETAMAAARRDGFAAMFALDARQARLIRR